MSKDELKFDDNANIIEGKVKLEYLKFDSKDNVIKIKIENDPTKYFLALEEVPKAIKFLMEEDI